MERRKGKWKRWEYTTKHQAGLHASDIYSSERLQTPARLKPAYFSNQQSCAVMQAICVQHNISLRQGMYGVKQEESGHYMGSDISAEVHTLIWLLISLRITWATMKKVCFFFPIQNQSNWLKSTIRLKHVKTQHKEASKVHWQEVRCHLGAFVIKTEGDTQW